ncbi:aluminum-activated malate transporter 2 [Morus notabilis]|uniref:aluminum-activated malate transporter 2 n=1 Tax=Morus notabilis TaxID=981085 RepID=UPI000CED2226|nr:aluminum-activated malate transporter 2 [Morus notabilis]
MAFGFQCLRALPVKYLVAKVVDFAEKTKKVAKDDPRRVIHSIKVGLALVLISLYYNFQPFYDGFGVDAMWAVITVVVVSEFSVGATIGKIINRTAATLLAGALGVGLYSLAALTGSIGKLILLTAFVFLVGSVATFMRFCPRIKARNDYGLLIFILTFCMVIVPGYQDDEVWETAYKRFSTVAIGCFTAVTVCLCICPVWSGVELQNSVSNNIEKLGNFLEGFGAEYFATMEDDRRSTVADKSSLESYKSVLTSKNTEDAMVNLASWEPRYGRFRFNHPWKEYIKIGTLSRQCAYKLEALNSYLKSDIQTPAEIKTHMREPCVIICSESGKLLKELAGTMRKPINQYSSISSTCFSRSDLLKTAAESLKTLLKGQSWWEQAVVFDVIPAAAVALQLIEVVTCAEKIAKAVHELTSTGTFETEDTIATPTPEQQPNNMRREETVVPEAVIMIGDG